MAADKDETMAEDVAVEATSSEPTEIKEKRSPIKN